MIARFIVLSALAHFVLFWALSYFRPTVIPPRPALTLKTYLVIEPPVVIPKEPVATVQPLESSEQVKDAPTEPPVEQTKVTSQAQTPPANGQTNAIQTLPESVVQSTVTTVPLEQENPTSKSKKLNITPSSLLESINAKAYSEYAQTRQAPTGRANPARLGVPETHQNLNGKDTRTVLSKNNLWTEYKDGDSCYKEMNHDPNNPPPDGFPKTWTAPVECKQSAIKDAYKEAMNKWLPKKN